MIDGCNLNIDLSSSNALGLILGPARLKATITNTVKKNDQPMLIRNGIWYTCTPFSVVGNAVYNQVSFPERTSDKRKNA